MPGGAGDGGGRHVGPAGRHRRIHKGPLAHRPGASAAERRAAEGGEAYRGAVPGALLRELRLRGGPPSAPLQASAAALVRCCVAVAALVARPSPRHGRPARRVQLRRLHVRVRPQRISRPMRVAAERAADPEHLHLQRRCGARRPARGEVDACRCLQGLPLGGVAPDAAAARVLGLGPRNRRQRRAPRDGGGAAAGHWHGRGDPRPHEMPRLQRRPRRRLRLRRGDGPL
mmetsp:Transcript_124652/g.360619  ORF Transcript_124652/g.360619 Transcript_124652/m.360619 type:complete len:229 (-) Transcript_124652:225-911(-)